MPEILQTKKKSNKTKPGNKTEYFESEINATNVKLDKKKPTCRFCKKIGHLISTCRFKKRDGKQKEQEQLNQHKELLLKTNKTLVELTTFSNHITQLIAQIERKFEERLEELTQRIQHQIPKLNMISIAAELKTIQIDVQEIKIAQQNNQKKQPQNIPALSCERSTEDEVAIKRGQKQKPQSRKPQELKMTYEATKIERLMQPHRSQCKSKMKESARIKKPVPEVDILSKHWFYKLTQNEPDDPLDQIYVIYDIDSEN